MFSIYVKHRGIITDSVGICYPIKTISAAFLGEEKPFSEEGTDLKTVATIGARMPEKIFKITHSYGRARVLWTMAKAYGKA